VGVPVTAATPSFEEVYRAYFAYVWRTLRRLGVREADAPDAAQEAFLVVHRRLAEFEGRAKLSTWLFRICLHVASDHSRRAHVRREVLDGADFDALSHPASRADAGALLREDLARLERGLSALDIDERAVFVLFEIEGATSAEIAASLEVPLGTVYSRLRRARQIFVDALACERPGAASEKLWEQRE
jgi:RNA polymerase sigma-70 factor (ECF subfamily)